MLQSKEKKCICIQILEQIATYITKDKIWLHGIVTYAVVSMHSTAYRIECHADKTTFYCIRYVLHQLLVALPEYTNSIQGTLESIIGISTTQTSIVVL